MLGLMHLLSSAPNIFLDKGCGIALPFFSKEPQCGEPADNDSTSLLF